MNTDDPNRSLGDAATFAGSSKRRSVDASLGDERTLGGGDAAGIDTVFDDIEVIDLAARYKTEGTLGRGGMGEVLLAIDTRLDRKVAIKRILGEAARSKTAVSRFLTEAKAIAALNHPNVVQIYDYGRASDGPFLIMEYVDGSSLLDRCRDGALPLEQAVDLACQLCDGLAKAHDLGIVHRDIKPANVLLTKDGLPKLTDFGLAKAEAADHQMTMTGAVLGTPDFMPPEQRKDAALVDHRSDLWSLAATFYQMVTGRSPKIIRFDLLPPGLTSVLGKALEDSKDDRYQSVREFRDALKTSLVAAAPAASELGEGQCPACGVKNDSSRRFCRGCGEPLEAPCLSCSKPMPMWEEICGQCGANQATLLENRRAEMAAQQAQAKELLGDFEFARATSIATQLRNEAHPQLKHLSRWAALFLKQIKKSQDDQNQKAIDAIEEAGNHEATHDYLAAAFALEAIPKALRTAVLPGMRESVASMLNRIKISQADAQLLEAQKAKQKNAVRTIVDAISTSHQRLANQIAAVVRRGKAEHMDIARDHAAAHDYLLAIQTLDALPPKLRDREVEALIKTYSDWSRESDGLITIIADRIKQKSVEGLLPSVERAVTLRGDYRGLAKLRDQLAEQRDGRLRRAHAAMDAGDAKTAAAAFTNAAMEDFSRNQQELIVRVRRAAALEEQIVTLVKDAKAHGKVTPEKAVEMLVAGERYLSLNPKNQRVAELVARSRKIAGPLLQERFAKLAQETLAKPPIYNSIGIELKLLPAGTFTMGQAGADSDEVPHNVTLTKAFYIGVYPVTNAQWARVMGSTPSNWKGADRPVVNVDWDDADEFCQRLSALPEEMKAGRVYRLPSEAEWEYACRAGTTTTYSFGDDESRLGEYAWFLKNSGGDTHSVGQRKPNPWGLFDMHGNVLEWCSDWYEGEYGSDDVTDPLGPSKGCFRIYRGGSWDFTAWGCRSSLRLGDDQACCLDFLGFRLALSPFGE